MKILRSANYRQEYLSDDIRSGLVNRYRRFSNDLEACYNKPGLAKTLDSDLRRGRLISTLTTNLKSHKLAGEVACRAIHASAQHAFRPGFRFVAQQLKPFLRSLQHLIIDSSDLVRKLSRIEVQKDDRMYKFDVKDFFMSGGHVDLAKFARVFPFPILISKKTVRDYVESLLGGPICWVRRNRRTLQCADRERNGFDLFKRDFRYCSVLPGREGLCVIPPSAQQFFVQRGVLLSL